MKQLTVRYDDPILEKKFKQRAKLASQSMNERIVELMRRDAGLLPKSTFAKKSEHSLKKFYGSFSEGAISQEVLDDFERIDPEMWK